MRARGWVGLGLILLLSACSAFSQAALKPKKSFSRKSVPTPPDYRLDRFWAALPGIADEADALFEGAEDGQAKAGVDVFYVHPTTYYSRASWNAPLDVAKVNRRTDKTAVRNQASAFSTAMPT